MRYWLMKSEPDCYSLSDLERDGKDTWAGVRNYQARNFMRDDMKGGDQVLYYHSSCPVPGVVGIAEVVSEPHPDPTQFDSSNEYFDGTSDPLNPRWILVDIGFKCHFKRIVTLNEIKEDSDLSQMRVAQRGNRLSIVPVDEIHFKEVVRRGN